MYRVTCPKQIPSFQFILSKYICLVLLFCWCFFLQLFVWMFFLDASIVEWVSVFLFSLLGLLMNTRYLHFTLLFVTINSNFKYWRKKVKNWRVCLYCSQLCMAAIPNINTSIVDLILCFQICTRFCLRLKKASNQHYWSIIGGAITVNCIKLYTMCKSPLYFAVDAQC